MKKYLVPSLLLFSGALFADNGAAARPGANSIQMIGFLVLALLFFYFILWRPEQKRRKAIEKQRSSMEKGDVVIAIGIKGTVAQIKKDTVILRMVDGSKIEVLKAAISDVQKPAEEKEEDANEEK